MIVGIDYTAAVWQGAGIGRYTRELVGATVALGGPFRYVLFYAAGNRNRPPPFLDHLHHLCADVPSVRVVPIPLSPRLLTIAWQRLRLPLYVEYFTGKLDIVHAPDFVLPPTRARTILTVHDLTFLLHPACFAPSLHHYLSQAVPRSLEQANLVLADSHATRSDVIRLLPVTPERCVVVYPGVSPRFCPLPASEVEPVRQQLNLPRSFFLFVGTLEPRKNLVRLLEALARLAPGAEGYDPACETLVIAGRKGWLYEEIFATMKRLRLEPRVRVMDFVDDEMLPSLYNLAGVFVYPSLYEGFGLPVLEALACGTPVVTSAVASLPEVAGDAAVLVNPHASEAIAAGMLQAQRDHERLRRAGPQQAQRFRWEPSARSLQDCYRQVYDASGE
ncbi:MAG: glycosyltransferase family 4 protein [Chloroflexaceae bacterium]|nr:glycosyltransferase family 4 protein [Chloroflexaceae bacterium]